nr:GMC oxidoreductase [Mesorhizobium amorphae]
MVDPECRVIGVDGLRVADSSIFPRVTNGNLNAPSIMTGEKAADHILGRTPLAPSNRNLDQSALAGLGQIEHHRLPHPAGQRIRSIPCAPNPRHRTTSMAVSSTTNRAYPCQ